MLPAPRIIAAAAAIMSERMIISFRDLGFLRS
jgi:hypothetical protein